MSADTFARSQDGVMGKEVVRLLRVWYDQIGMVRRHEVASRSRPLIPDVFLRPAADSWNTVDAEHANRLSI